MVYVILGILVLILSFVVALVSLIYEQRKMEEKKDEDDFVPHPASPQSASRVQDIGSVAQMQQQSQPQPGPQFTQEPTVEVPNMVVGQRHDVPAQEPQKTQSEVLPPFQQEPPAAVSESRQSADEGNVWWNRLHDAGQEPQKSKEDQQEEESIRAIRDELSKLISSKTSPEIVQDKEVATQELQDVSEENKKQRVLMGEFSLDGIKKTD